MPTIARFYGIEIGMFYNEHEPLHFHATYAEHEVVIRIGTLAVQRGALPRRARRFVLEWARLREELNDNWRRARAGSVLRQIEGLE